MFINNLQANLKELQNLSCKNQIKMLNAHFDTIVNQFSYILINQDNINEINNIQQKSNILLLDKYQESNSIYIIICFDNYLVLISADDLNLLLPFYDKNKDIKLFSLEKEINDLFLEQISIDESKTSDICIYEINSLVQDEIDSFSNRFLIENSKLTLFWQKIKRCISGFLIQKSHHKYFLKNRIKYYMNNFEKKRVEQNIAQNIRTYYDIETVQKKYEEIEISEDEYIELRPLSSGSSSVCLIYYIKDESHYILKIFGGKDEKKLFERERNNYLKITHPFVPKYIGFVKNKTNMNLIVEYIEGNSLDEIKNMNLSIDEKIKIIFELMVSIQYLHLHKFIYRDLKPNNIIVDVNKTVIVIDFDRMIECTNNEFIENEDENITTQDFSHIFVAPEVVSANKFSYEADVYSIGMIIYYILFEKMPLSINSDMFQSEFSDIYDLYTKCTNLNPKNRPLLSNLIKFFFNEFYSPVSPNLIENDTMKSIENINDNKYIRYLIYISENKNIYSLFHLGRMYDLGINVSINYSKAFHYYTLSENLPESKNNLGNMYKDGLGVKKNINKAINYYTIAANQNCSIAQYNLGIKYLHGFLVQHDANKAFRYLISAAKQNESNALLELGIIYENGWFTPRNIDKAIYYYTLSSKQNNTEAFYRLGCIYDNNIYISQDIYKAFNYYLQAANLNHPTALFNIGNYYFNGVVVQKNFKKAFEYYLLAAEQKYPKSYYYIGRFYHYGIYVAKCIKKACEYYLIASNYNIKEAQFAIGNLYFFGIELPQDYQKAIYYFTQAAKQNDLDALNNLGLIYLYTNEYRNVEKGIYYFTLAASQMSTEGLFNLGIILYNGEIVPQDVKKGILYLQYSSNKNFPPAHEELGNIYLFGNYVERDIDKAIHYYSLASNANMTKSQYILGIIYFYGLNGKQNIKNAIYYLKCSSKNYFAPSAFFLGNFYLEGKLIERDIDESIRYYKDSSSFNNNYAKNNLGIIYKKGFYTGKNINYAIILFNEAISQKNDEVAMYNLAHIYFYDKDIANDFQKAINLLASSSKIMKFNYSKILLCIVLIKKLGTDLITKDKIMKELNNNNLSIEIFRLIKQFQIDNINSYDIFYETFSKIDLYYNYTRNPVIFSCSVFKDQKAIKKDMSLPIDENFYKGFGYDII